MKWGVKYGVRFSCHQNGTETIAAERRGTWSAAVQYLVALPRFCLSKTSAFQTRHVLRGKCCFETCEQRSECHLCGTNYVQIDVLLIFLCSSHVCVHLCEAHASKHLHLNVSYYEMMETAFGLLLHHPLLLWIMTSAQLLSPFHCMFEGKRDRPSDSQTLEVCLHW